MVMWWSVAVSSFAVVVVGVCVPIVGRKGWEIECGVCVCVRVWRERGSRHGVSVGQPVYLAGHGGSRHVFWCMMTGVVLFRSSKRHSIPNTLAREFRARLSTPHA